MTPRPPVRRLPAHPDLDQLKRQAKELLAAFAAGDAEAAAEVRARFSGADPARFALHDAQLVLARSYGFDSWPKLKAFVDGMTAGAFCDRVERGDVAAARAMLQRRPELVAMERPGHGEARALHIAVLRRDLPMVRLLMAYGADARLGIYPNRDATSPLTLATERDFDDVARIMRDAEARRSAGDRAAHDAIEWGPMPLTGAAKRRDLAAARALLAAGADPDEPVRVPGIEQPEFSRGTPLYTCVEAGDHAFAALLLDYRADPNAQVFTSGSATFAAHRANDAGMIRLLEQHGGALAAADVGYVRRADLARRMLDGELDPRLDEGRFSGDTVAEQLLWSGATGGSPEIVRMALDHVDWPRDDPRWFWMLWRPMPGHTARPEEERRRCHECFGLILERCDPNVRHARQGQTMIHETAARDHGEGVALATRLLDAGARLDIRDHLLQSTPLGWACRWGRLDLVRLFLDRGADAHEAGADPWARPRAWARKRGHAAVLQLLESTPGRDPGTGTM
jgi:hypothetical protein